MTRVGGTFLDQTLRYRLGQEQTVTWGLSADGTGVRVGDTIIGGGVSSVTNTVDVEEGGVDLGSADTLDFSTGIRASGAGDEKTITAALHVQNASGTEIANDTTGIHTIKPGTNIDVTVASNVATIVGPSDADFLAATTSSGRYVTVKTSTTGAPVLSVDDLTADSERFYSGKERTDIPGVHMIQRTRVVTDSNGNVTTPVGWRAWNGNANPFDEVLYARKLNTDQWINIVDADGNRVLKSNITTANSVHYKFTWSVGQTAFFAGVNLVEDSNGYARISIAPVVQTVGGSRPGINDTFAASILTLNEDVDITRWLNGQTYLANMPTT